MGKGNFKIRVKENIGKDSVEAFGRIGTILEVKNGVFRDIENHTWFNNYKRYKTIEDVNNQFYNEGYVYKTLFELVVEDNTYKDFAKQDLKTGMVVELRNGKYGMVLLGTGNGDIISGTAWFSIDEFDENLNSTMDYDVIKIYQPTSNRDFLYDGEINIDEANLIWERKEEPQPKEMTVEKIEKELGYNIKIVK